MEVMSEYGEFQPSGILYETHFPSDNGSTALVMALGKGSGVGSVFMVVDTNSSDNMTDDFMQGEPFTMPLYILVWVTVANILVFLAGVVGNTLVIVVVLCVREMKTATNLCLMNLSVADLLVLLICQSSALIEFFGNEKWLLGEVMCKLVAFLENLVTVASILIILTVSLERFWAVYYPLKTYSQGSKSKAMISMAIVWVTAGVATFPFLLMAYTDQQFHRVDNETVDVCITAIIYTWHKAYIIGRFIFIFAIPMCLLAILYSLIIVKVRKETMECKQMTETAKSQSQQNRRQLVAMLVGIILLFFVCLLPFRIVALWETFSPPGTAMQLGPEPYLNIIYFCRLLIYVNSAGNPIIYNIVSTKFRRAFQKVLRLYCCCCKKSFLLSRGALNGTYSQGTRMTTMSHYSVVRQDNQDISDTGDAV